MADYPSVEGADILVVDDDARLRSLLQRFLSEQGHRVATAADAAEARGAIAAMAFDLLVLDVMMPGETGLELAEALRRDKVETPILMLTARGAPDDRVAGFEHGADDYLAKPFDPRELALRIRTILRRAAPPPHPPPGRSSSARWSSMPSAPSCAAPRAPSA
jgi:two-component system phosphate regulon response regulator OmpR